MCVAPASSPFLAVGDAVVRFSPHWLTEFAKATFGTADKPVLLAGMAVVIACIAALAGLASRRHPGPGDRVVIVLGVARARGGDVRAGLRAAGPARADGVAGGGRRGVPVAARARARRRRNGPIRRRNPEASPGAALLVRSAAAVGVASLAGGAGGLWLGRGAGDSRGPVTARLAGARLAERAPAIPAPRRLPRASGTPHVPDVERGLLPDRHGAAGPGAVGARTGRCASTGWSTRELTLTFDDLLARPLVERPVTLACVSNPVGGDLISTATFTGVDLRDLLLEAGVRPGADQAFSTSVDGWYTGTPVDVLLEPGRGAMLAIGMNGEALPLEHGFPVRMVVPGLYGFVSATKWITDLELTTFDAKAGYWLERGWAERAPIKTQSRIDSPRGFASLPAGRVTVAGIAWSQPTGIARGRGAHGRRAVAGRGAGHRGERGHLADVARRRRPRRRAATPCRAGPPTPRAWSQTESARRARPGRGDRVAGGPLLRWPDPGRTRPAETA